MKKVVGLVLLLVGSSLFILSFFSATRTDTVIDSSFVLETGEEYETYYHTRIIGKSSLTGEVVVEGAGVYLTAYGHNTKHLENVFTDQNLSFTINPADDLYTFTFENSGSSVQSSVKFTLEEKWLSFFMLIPGFIGLLISAPAGIALIIVGLRKKQVEARGSLKSAGCGI